MNPIVNSFETKNGLLKFTVSGINVSIANAIRRIILSEIPIIIFRTSPYDKNKCNIIANTSRFNNEIIKQRLSCIPIHIKDIKEFPIKNYLLEVNVENNTDTIMYITTENFIIKDLITDKILPKEQVREIFPADDITGYFIDFVRLRPRISDELHGEHLHLTCEFDIGTAKEDGMFNVVSTCSYGFTEDVARQEVEIAKKIQQWKDEGKNEKEIDFEHKNWKLLEAKRIFKKDSYDFIIESIGINTNNEIVIIACQILIEKLNQLDDIIDKDELEIKKSETTMSNCFDIILENEDYTIGKVIEYILFINLFETKIVNYCAFNKKHPHDNFSIIRLSYQNPVEKSSIKGHLKESINDGKSVFTKLKKEFTKF